MTRHVHAHLRTLLRVIAGALVLVLAVFAITAGGAPPVAEPEIQPTLAPEAQPIDPRIPLSDASGRWVESRLRAMSLEEKVGQVLMVRAFGEYYPEDAEQRRELVSLVEELALGGVILFRSQAYAGAALLDDLQTAAANAGHLPLIVAADFEWGADFRIDGAVPFPTAMAVGATFESADAEWMGSASARDARALGIHWIFAPVADVNVNPRNPVINVRAFGEQPEHVATMVEAFVRGAQREGVLATAKHFPGHGDTAVDSHISLPVLSHDSERLQQVELAPFRAAIDAGVASVMTAHMAVPALTADRELPATLSYAVLTDLLRDQLAFEGLIVTDAMEMGGISRRWWSGQAAVEALAAGADMVLLPPNPRAVHAAVVRAVERGDLHPERLDDAVRKVLAAKARLGITESSAAQPLAGLPSRFALASELDAAREVSDRAVTLLRDRGPLLPLDARTWQSVVVVGISDNDSPAPTDDLVAALRAPLANVSAYSIDGRTRGDEAAAIVSAAARARTVILAVRVRVRTSTGNIQLPERQERYAKMLADLEVPTIVVALGSPYAAAAFPQASTVLATYGWSPPLQRSAARAIVGAIPIRGRLPVSVPGLYPVGHGETRPRLDATLRRVEVSPVDLEPAREALRQSIAAGAFPGATYAIGYRGELVGLGAEGRMSSEPGARAMPVDAIFDLASLTKVVGTLPVAMLAVEQGALRLDYPVQALVPEFEGNGKEEVTIRHLLTHSSGLPAYEEFFREFTPEQAGEAARQRVLERIYATDLQSTPGTRYVYSDLGILLLGEVLDRALGESFEAVAQREIFAPLGMRDTGWRPPASSVERIPPTEDDPWRGRTVRGQVHDRNAFVVGGVAPHAGLFSTAADLAIYAQTMLDLGTYGHVRVLSRATVDTWRRRQELVPGSSRALGWDTALGSDRWGMFDPAAYGHTGFTGTSLWIDSSRDLFVVLLTNRVHPTRDNDRHVQARVDFHEAVVRAVDGARGR